MSKQIEAIKLAMAALDASATCNAAYQDLVQSLASRVSAERMRLELRAEEASHNEKLAHAGARAACIAALEEQPAPVQPRSLTDADLDKCMSRAAERHHAHVSQGLQDFRGESANNFYWHFAREIEAARGITGGNR